MRHSEKFNQDKRTLEKRGIKNKVVRLTGSAAIALALTFGLPQKGYSQHTGATPNVMAEPNNREITVEQYENMNDVNENRVKLETLLKKGIKAKITEEKLRQVRDALGGDENLYQMLDYLAVVGNGKLTGTIKTDQGMIVYDFKIDEKQGNEAYLSINDINVKTIESPMRMASIDFDRYTSNMSMSFDDGILNNPAITKAVTEDIKQKFEIYKEKNGKGFWEVYNAGQEHRVSIDLQDRMELLKSHNQILETLDGPAEQADSLATLVENFINEERLEGPYQLVDKIYASRQYLELGNSGRNVDLRDLSHGLIDIKKTDEGYLIKAFFGGEGFEYLAGFGKKDGIAHGDGALAKQREDASSIIKAIAKMELYKPKKEISID